MDLAIRIGLIVLLVVVSAQIFAPFAGLVLWGVILAVALYPLQRRLARRLGGRQGGAATVLVLLGILLLGIPTLMLGSSFAGHIHNVHTAFENDALKIGQPPPSVADWPLVGDRVFKAWSEAANDLPAFVEDEKAQLSALSKKVAAVAARTAGELLLFVGSLIVAGIVMAYGEAGHRVVQRIFIRLSGPVRGPRLNSLSTATIRSVATGVVGVAFIQALLLGIGFMLAGIPGAGVLALIVLVLGIAQLPALIVSLPAIAYLWWAGDFSTLISIVFTVYLLLAGMADNVLKPLLLGRGVEAPMPVILLGALGGMVTVGMLGLFLGAVLLAVAYQLFMEWVDEVADDTAAEPVSSGGGAASQ